MIERKQLLRHEPHNEIYGDCNRTAIACLLDKEPWEVPHFAQLWATTPGYDWKAGQREWLRFWGFGLVTFVYPNDLDSMFAFMRDWNPRLNYLLSGTSPRGFSHTVICSGGGFRWDPSPHGGFLVGPLDSGFYELEILVPISQLSD